MREFQKGDRVQIIEWAVGNVGPYAKADREKLVGRTGTVINAGLYVSVELDDDPAYVKASVIAEESELRLYDDNAEQAAS
jgi:ribosomal protein L21E